MANDHLPTPAQVRQLLDYDPATGVLTWRARSAGWFAGAKYPGERLANTFNKQFAGAEAFACRNATGYRYAKLMGRNQMGHRVAFAHYHGVWPEGEIDHINGIRDDNRISNLREASRSLNMRNTRSARGYKFMTDGRRAPWVAYIRDGGKNIRLGGFETEAEAASARARAEKKYGYGVWS